MERVYKVSFTKSSFGLIDDYDKLSDIDKERISNLEASALFDFDDEIGYKFYIIVESLEFKTYTKILKENFIQHEVEDISENILLNGYDIEKSTKKFVSPLNTIKFSFFLDDLNIWIYQNLEIDIVLDRISQVGIKNLTKIEQNFLANYSQDN